MSRRTAALACGLFVLPTLVSTPLLAEAAPASPTAHLAAKKPVTTKKRGRVESATRTSSAKGPVARRPGSAPRTTSPGTPASGSTRAVFTSRAVAGPVDLVDSAGRTWTRRPAGLGSWKSATTPDSTDIARTRDDALYRRTAPGVRWYRLQVPKGTYRVRLLLQENQHSAAGRRVFDVKAEGRVVRAGVDIAKAVGRDAAYDVTFTVPVSDGRLDLDFVTKRDVPVISGIEVVSTAAVTQKAPAPLVTLARDSFFTQDISRAPLAADSDAVAAHLLRQVKGHWGGVAAFNAYRYNNSFYEVPATQKKVRVEFYDCQRKGYLPSGLFDGPKHFADVPIPPNALPATGTDKQLTIYDRSADKLWDFWVTEKQPNGSWRACWGGRIDDVSKSQGIFARPYGATASGLAMTPGAISVDDIRRGSIDHAMYLAVIEAATWQKVSWPANRSDGNSQHPHALMEGQRVRLDPNLDLSTIPMTPIARTIAVAAQKYGFVVADKAGAVAVITESGNREKAATGTNPWDELLVGPDYEVMRGFPWEHIQVLPKDYGKPGR